MSVSFYLIKDGEIVYEPHTTVIEDEVFEDNALSVNVHNKGAAALAQVLNINLHGDMGCTGQVRELAAFEHRCREVLFVLECAPQLDGERETEESGGPGTGCARWVDCGLPAGYLTRNVTRLRALAERALLDGAALVWA